MPAPATAFPAGLVATFDLLGTQSVSARRAAGPNTVDVLPEAQPDNFEDLLGLAVAGAPFNAVATQPILNVPAQPPETSVVQGATGGSAESAQRASLLATVTQNGRLAAPSKPAIPSVGEIAPNRESGDVADVTPVGGASTELPTSINAEPPIVAASSPNADVSTNDGGSRAAADQTSATVSVIASGPFASAQSTAAEQAPTKDVSAEADVEELASGRTDHPVEASARAHVVASTSTGIPIQDAANPESAAADGDHAESDVAATDSQTTTDQSAEGLRPVSELAQDVQTVPQPEALASSLPAAIAADTSLISNEAVAAGVTPAVASSSGAALRMAADAAMDARGTPDRSARGGKDVRAGAPDSSAFDVAGARDELTDQSIESAQSPHSSSGEDTSSEQGSGTGADAPLRTAADEAMGVCGTPDRSARGGKDVRAGAPDSSAFDVTGARDKLAEQSIASAQTTQSSSDDGTSSEQGSGTGSDAAPRTAADAAMGVRGTPDRSARGSKDVRAGTPDSSALDVMAATDELSAPFIESVQSPHSSSGEDTSSEQGSGTGADANTSAMTTLGSSSATGAPAPPSESAVSGSSVVQQISSAVQDWRAALQEQGTARFSAWLNPPNLGHVYVELTRSADGITARLSASDDGVQSVLESQGPELRQALNDAGIAVTELDVSGGSAGDSGSQQERQPPSDRRDELETTLWRAESQPHRRPSPAHSGAVDVRV